jgi:hypothetical protein
MQATRPRMTRDQLIDYCADILRKKGRSVEVRVPCGINSSLKADIVTWTTVYEFRETLDREKLYEAKGQGLTYAGWLKKNRVVIVGYLPDDPAKRGLALLTAGNIEKAGYARVSFVDLDPFWELTPVSYRWLKLAALSVATIALTVWAIPLVREEVQCRVYPEVETCISQQV